VITQSAPNVDHFHVYARDVCYNFCKIHKLVLLDILLTKMITHKQPCRYDRT